VNEGLEVARAWQYGPKGLQVIALAENKNAEIRRSKENFVAESPF
jgi:hypothetical protein